MHFSLLCYTIMSSSWKNHTTRNFGVIFIRHIKECKKRRKNIGEDQTERERSRVPIAFKPLKHRRISMWIRLLEYTGSRYMRERMYVNMPTLSEAPLWSNPTLLRHPVGDTMAFDLSMCQPASKTRRSPCQGSYVPSPAFRQPAYRHCRVVEIESQPFSRIHTIT